MDRTGGFIGLSKLYKFIELTILRLTSFIFSGNKVLERSKTDHVQQRFKIIVLPTTPFHRFL